MARAGSRVASRTRRKKIMDAAKGYYSARSRTYRVARQAVTKAGQYAYRDRRQRKRQFRALWIVRINAGAREHGLSYSRFINGLKLAGIEMDRRVMADIAMFEPDAFAKLAEQARAALEKAALEAAQPAALAA